MTFARVCNESEKGVLSPGVVAVAITCCGARHATTCIVVYGRHIVIQFALYFTLATLQKGIHVWIIPLEIKTVAVHMQLFMCR